jgi:hypothetical protein
MKTATLLAFVCGCLLVSTDSGLAQAGRPEYTGVTYMKTLPHCTVTIARNGVVLTSLTFQEGTFLSAQDEHRHPIRTSDGMEFHGDFQLRVLPSSEVPAGVSDLAPIISQAPVALAANGVDVVIRNRR